MMERIDAHQHFWKYDSARDSWISHDMKVIRRDFLPEDLEPLLKKNGFDACVVVQSDQSEDENVFQLANAEKHSFIKGVVGWTDLRAENVEEVLAGYRAFPKLKGFRHILQGEADRAFMLRPDFKRGISFLNKFSYTYDILIFPDQLKYVREFVAAFPDQPFVINHIAKPLIKEQKPGAWKKEMEALAEHENVSCKISGLVTEAPHHNWKKEDFTPYLDVVTEAFGPKRIMFGSDWPVCLLSASYQEVTQLMKDYFAPFSTSEQAMFFGGNAAAFYRLGAPGFAGK